MLPETNMGYFMFQCGGNSPSSGYKLTFNERYIRFNAARTIIYSSFSNTLEKKVFRLTAKGGINTLYCSVMSWILH